MQPGQQEPVASQEDVIAEVECEGRRAEDYEDVHEREEFQEVEVLDPSYAIVAGLRTVGQMLPACQVLACKEQDTIRKNE